MPSNYLWDFYYHPYEGLQCPRVSPTFRKFDISNSAPLLLNDFPFFPTRSEMRLNCFFFRVLAGRQLIYRKLETAAVTLLLLIGFAMPAVSNGGPLAAVTRVSATRHHGHVLVSRFSTIRNTINNVCSVPT